MRSSGILLPIASLPTKYGIGGFSGEAYEFVDMLAESGQKNWQILPLGPTGYGDSPYQSFSTFAGNPYFVSLDRLKEEGLLTEEECLEADQGQYPEYVDYERIYKSRFQVLYRAFLRFCGDSVRGEETDDYRKFLEENREWLDDYCTYSVIKKSLGEISWLEWPEELKRRDPSAVAAKKEELEETVRFRRFIQFQFARQWADLKKYANDRGIRIIGDVPIYVAMDSADAWAAPEMFQFDENLTPSAVSGCPPDAYAVTGQLWGNPLYNWEYHKKTGFHWWIRRMQHAFQWYDVVRIDHFRGFESYYSVPYGDTTAENGHWEPGPNLDIFRAMDQALGEMNVIAEDLGFLTDDVRTMVKDCGYPGMKVLQFAFDAGADNEYLPHNYKTTNCVVYTGTHDNETTLGWYRGTSDAVRKYAEEYVGYDGGGEERFVWELVGAAMESVADLCVIPMQDYLCLGSEARINTPSTLGDNWKWRLQKGEFTHELAGKIRELTQNYGR